MKCCDHPGAGAFGGGVK